MEQETISKKELLKLTGISYGQLYRWKRKNIIPEDWFIKKSSFTGQETFFPKKKILKRIEAIKDMKDEYSLDDLSAFFSPRPADVALSAAALLKHKVIKSETMTAFKSRFVNERFDFNSILFLTVAEEVVNSKKLEIRQCEELLDFMMKRYKEVENKSSELIAFRKKDVIFWVFISPPVQIISESETFIRISLGELVNQLKLRLSVIH
ncbi:YhbD family protein [Bacillus sp. F19]|nr:YhbD family protein [Bacillus sp. F19]